MPLQSSLGDKDISTEVHMAQAAVTQKHFGDVFPALLTEATVCQDRVRATQGFTQMPHALIYVVAGYVQILELLVLGQNEGKDFTVHWGEFAIDQPVGREHVTFCWLRVPSPAPLADPSGVGKPGLAVLEKLSPPNSVTDPHPPGLRGTVTDHLRLTVSVTSMLGSATPSNLPHHT
ncbi:hypothetical protein AAY473_019781 [Plecturocebus cupreus]